MLTWLYVGFSGYFILEAESDLHTILTTTGLYIIFVLVAHSLFAFAKKKKERVELIRSIDSVVFIFFTIVTSVRFFGLGDIGGEADGVFEDEEFFFLICGSIASVVIYLVWLYVKKIFNHFFSR